MTNKEFWKSISTIINNGFDKDGIIKLEDYAEQFFNKQLLFKRYSPSEQHGCATGGSFHVVASILAGAETPTNQLTAPEGSFKRDCQRAEAQAAVIEQWAKTTGCWVDDVDKDFEQTFGEQLAEGGEAHVYDNGNTIIKRIGLDYYILPVLALDLMRQRPGTDSDHPCISCRHRRECGYMMHQCRKKFRSVFGDTAPPVSGTVSV